MKLIDKCNILNLLYTLSNEMYEQAEQGGGDVNETVDEGIRTPVCFLD